ncbi:MAG: cation acetate symporter, partial [Planctomycetaceae bacterium]
MIYEPSAIAVVIFFIFVGITLGISFWLGRQAQDSQGYFAAHGQIPWFVNGVAFAGDYLSAASFLGICGMIAFYGYDGFLYSIGYLAGWIVALFVVAEPMKKLGKFTFADALDAKFGSPGIKLAAGISTLAVSVFYLIPQMVGAGVLVQPLLGFDHWVGVVIVGVTVILIVVTAGMVSTTWVQFIKGSLLVVFSAILTLMILNRGFESGTGEAVTGLRTLTLSDTGMPTPESDWELLEPEGPWKDTDFIRLKSVSGNVSVWTKHPDGENTLLLEAQTLTKTADGKILVNGEEKGSKKGEPELHPIGHIRSLPDDYEAGSPVGPLEFFSTLQKSEVVLWPNRKIQETDGSRTTVYYQKPTPGSHVLRPGEHPRFKGIRSDEFLD